MQHLLARAGRYYFNRRVPTQYRNHDTRNYIRIALHTTNLKEARRLAFIQNENLEQYWENLERLGRTDSDVDYEDVVRHAKLLGFHYMPNTMLSQAPLPEIISRLNHVHRHDNDRIHALAVLGGAGAPSIKLDHAFEKYCEYAKGEVFNKSPNQLRKWKQPRLRTVNNFIDAVGNKPITEITREDILNFRDWWLIRLKTKQMAPNTANKNFIQLKVILETVGENMKIEYRRRSPVSKNIAEHERS